MKERKHMEEIEKAVKLYTLIAERCMRNGLSPEQARIYSEMAIFFSKCSNIEEATLNIKNSKYYLAPSVALVKDKINARLKAAREDDMPEVARVYEEKLRAINNNEQEIYSSDYEIKAQNIRNEYIHTLQAFTEIFRCYVCFMCNGNETYINEIKTNLNNLIRPSSDFETLAGIRVFRDSTACTDKGYSLFVNAIKQIRAGSFTKRIDEDSVNNEVQSTWDAIKADKNKIKSRDTITAKNLSRAEYIATAPSFSEYNAAMAGRKTAGYYFMEG